MPPPVIVIDIPTWIISASAPTVAVVIGWWLNNRRLRIIHDNTNSQLSQALRKIEELQSELRDLKGKR